MSTTAMTVAMTAAMATTNVIGTAALKVSTQPEKEQFFLVGITCYILGAGFYVYLLKDNSLAVLSVASSTLQLGLMASLSIWYFGEKINLIQGSAMAVAIAASAVAMLAAAH